MSTPRRLAPRSIGTPIMRTFCGIRPFLIPKDFSKRRAPPGGPRHATSRIYAIEQAREGNHFADVRSPAYPGNGAFQAQAEAGMGHAAVAPQIEIPLEGFFRQVVLVQALHQQVVAGDALAAADDLAVAFRGEHVETKGQLGTLRIRLHVKRLDAGRVAMHDDRTVELRGAHGLLIAAEVVAPLP